MTLGRVEQFQQEILSIAKNGGSGNEEGDEASKDEVETTPDAVHNLASMVDAAVAEAEDNNNVQLMAHTRALMRVTDADELLSKVVTASLCLDRKETIGGVVSFARKAKSLIGRWLAKSAVGVPDCGGDALTTNEIIIERDVVVLLNVKIGQGASAATVACH